MVGDHGVRQVTDKCDALIVGAGPAGLMAADVLAQAGFEVLVAESMPSVGRKFLMAGKSGLNLTRAEPIEEFLKRYGGGCNAFFEAVAAFGPKDVVSWAEALEQDVFTGSTGRVFPVAMKASPLLREWLKQLQERGVRLETRTRWVGWDGGDWLFRTPVGTVRVSARVAVLALGGASWRRLGSDGAWAEILVDAGIPLRPFTPSNVGLSIDWSSHMTPYIGQPVKSTRLFAGETESRGEWIITLSGIEGGGVYETSMAVRDGAALNVDLVPDLGESDIERRLQRQSEKASLGNRLRKALGLSSVKRALLLEWGRPLPDAEGLARLVKALPVPVLSTAPLDQAISTGGGVAWQGLDGFMLRARPGTFVAGEMLDWEAPTGGYLLTACLATGRAAGLRAAEWASSHADTPRGESNQENPP